MVAHRIAARAALLIFTSLLLLVIFHPQPAGAVGGEGEGWPAFNESDGCGSPWMRGPNVEASGWVPSSTQLRGPHADYFGRSIQQVWDSLAWWDVPMSNGERLRLHERMRPALDLVEDRLAQERSNGNFYSIIDRYTYGYAARTIGGAYRISQHGLGNALDINSVSNPYTTGPLKTNMPFWFVDAFSDSGFCWGGYWQSVKDAMHYNWRGPLFTPGMTELPAAYPPKTSPESFTRTMHTDGVPGVLDSTVHRLLMDGDGDGAVDVVNVSQTSLGTVIDVAKARSGYRGCSVSRYPAPNLPAGSVAINGDWDRDGAQDLWIIDDADGLDITAYIRFGDFTETESASISTAPGDAYLSADHDVDGWGDLYIFRFDGGWTVEVRDGADRFASVLATGSLPGAADTEFTAIDRDRDQVPDVFGVASSGSFIADGASTFSSVENVTGIQGNVTDIAGTDFDGDGRHDLVVLDGNDLRVFAGNSRLSGLRVTSWFEFPTFACGSSSLPYPYEGTFRD
ncbi:MAG: M15 family metallopeptidase, partial [Acidimicrobiia bacterium]